MSNVTGKIIALGGGGGASEAEVEELRSAIGNIETASASDQGKFLKAKTVENGKVTEYEYDTPAIDPEDIADAVDDWLNDHPEATTTVTDGSITEAKLATDVDGALFVSIPIPSVTTGGYVNNNGEEASSGSYSRTGYVPFTFNTRSLLTINCTVYDTVSFVFYDKNQRVIRIITGANASQYGITPSRSVERLTFEVPEGTAYFRASYLGTASTSSFNAKTNYCGESASIKNVLYDIAIGKTGEYQTYTGTSKKAISKQGTVGDVSDSSYYVTNNVAIEPDTYYMITACAGYGNGYYTILDANQNVVQFEKSPNTGGNVLANKLIFTPKNAAYIVVAYISTTCLAQIFKCTSLMPNEVKPYKGETQFLNISYSTLDLAAINTVETYISAGHFGFNACKGDVRPTSDGKLIMCHDDGFTLDGNGRIVSYNASSNTPIYSMTYAQCMELEYASKAGSSDNNHYQKVADIEQYLEVCKEYGMIAFVTIRDEHISDVLIALFAALKKYNMTDHCIINSYSIDSLKKVREITRDIPVSIVMATDRTLTKGDVNNTWVLGNSIMTLVSASNTMRTYITAQNDRLNDAVDKGIGLMFAQTITIEDVAYLRKNRFCGAQIGRTILPYRMTSLMFKVNISSGTPTIEEWNNLSTFDATISASGNVISVSDFCEDGSARGFSDRIMEVWMNKYPYRITATSEGGHTVTAAWQNNALKLTVADISVNDKIDVIIEV